MKANEQVDENYPTSRAGGDVITKSASQAPAAEKRAGGDVITKSASQRPDDSGSNQEPATDEGTRAGGDVITKGAGQKHD